MAQNPAWRNAIFPRQPRLAVCPWLPSCVCQARGAVPAVHRRCCPWHSASCSAWPWGISGGPGARRAARGSRGPAAAPPAAPPAACRGCSLRRAEASSSPSDPSGSPAARQRRTRQAHPDTGIVHSNITAPQNPTETRQFGAKERLCLCQGLKPKVTFGITAGFLLPSQTHHCTKNKPSEKSFHADISPVARQGTRGEGTRGQEKPIISGSGFSPL